MELTFQKMPGYKDGGYPEHNIVTSQRWISPDLIYRELYLSNRVHPDQKIYIFEKFLRVVSTIFVLVFFLA